MNASAVNTLNQVPLVNSTQILTQSAQLPAVSQVPLVTSVPVVSQVPMVTAPQPGASVVPNVIVNSHFTNQTQVGTLVEEDYRMGRGILDEFRPDVFKIQLGLIPNNTNVVTTTATSIPVATTQLVSTTPAVVPTGSANLLKEFL